MWKWCPERLKWLFSENEQIWVEDYPPLPDWFIKAEGQVSVAKFIEIWQQASTINDVKKELYWLSLDEISSFKELVSTELDRLSIQPLQKLLLYKKSLLSSTEIDQLVDKKLLLKEEFYEPESDVYDPMKALLKAQSKTQQSDRPHIQTFEVGNKFRHRAKH